MRQYRILKDGQLIKSSKPGKYAGYAPGKIFGTLTCKSGMRMNAENRVFFHSLEDAVLEGYRPCKNCKPVSEEEWETLKDLVEYTSLDEFYNRDNQ